MNKSQKQRYEEIKKLQELRECGNADHLVGADGKFTSIYPYGDGKVSIGYLEDLCQYLFYHPHMTIEQKMEYILQVEENIQDTFRLNGMNINYIPTWSVKLKQS